MTLFEKSQCFKKFTKTNDTSCTYKKVLHKMISEHIQHINFSDEGRPRKIFTTQIWNGIRIMNLTLSFHSVLFVHAR